MQILFLDDSYQSFDNNRYLGYGGFYIDADRLKELTKGISNLKSYYGIPSDVDLKWSPSPDHFLRTKFNGKRQDLYIDAIKLLSESESKVLCAVHHLESCYGINSHNWDLKKFRLWATKQQCKFISERFETICLKDTPGLIIADHYSDVVGETSLIRDVNIRFKQGTEYWLFDNLCIPPLTATPQECTPLQLADIVVGIVVASCVKNKYGLALFEEVAKIFVLTPQKDTTPFVSKFSYAVLGCGLKLFPNTFVPTGKDLFQELDTRYIYNSENGLKLK
jgi:hypothetical protein